MLTTNGKMFLKRVRELGTFIPGIAVTSESFDDLSFHLRALQGIVLTQSGISTKELEIITHGIVEERSKDGNEETSD